MEDRLLIRNHEPNKYDEVAYGTVCKVVSEKSFELYIQLSRDEQNPNWMRIAEFNN